MKSKLTLIFAGTALAVLIGSPVLANYTSKWSCRLEHRDNQYVGDVSIWWGHTEEDAAWACYNWIPECGNNGGCWARRI